MKAILMVSLLLGVGVAKACVPGDGTTEMQIVGNIVNVNHVNNPDAGAEHVTYQILIDESNPLTRNNELCRMDVDQAQKYIWWAQGSPAQITEGAPVKGILVFDSKTGIYHIE